MKKQLPTFRNTKQKKHRRQMWFLLSPVLALSCLVCALYLTQIMGKEYLNPQEESQQQESQHTVIQAGTQKQYGIQDLVPIEQEMGEQDLLAQEPVTQEQLQVIPADDVSMLYITPRMTYTYEVYDARTGELTQTVEPIPVEMYGLNRVELEQYLAQHSAAENKTLTEEQHHYELREFSRRSFTVRKTITQLFAVFLIAEEGYVVAYSGDRTQLYELTHIPLEDFPLEQQIMLTDGIYMKSMADYYDFLETYSS